MNFQTQVAALLALGAMIGAGCDDDVTAPTGPAGPVVGTIVLVLEAHTLSVRQTTRLGATVLSVDGDTLTDSAIAFLSSDDDVATVSGDGLVTAESPGLATLTARVDDVTARAVVRVRRSASISVAPRDTTLTVDDTLRLAVTVLDVDGAPVVNPQVRFISAVQGILDIGVDSETYFTAVGVGETAIIAETEGLTAAVEVQVVSEVGSVFLSPDSLTIAEGDTARLTVVVTDTTGAVITDPRVVFSCDCTLGDLIFATVDSTGLVNAVRDGSAEVVARSRGVTSNTAHITVGTGACVGCWDY